ncbi:MAG: M23 family metallopeptidase [Zetaproteobacteria bacterium]|nr:MAG: M23 family metallopeptidase [Zetaproteobacteria bacterium]
MKVGCMLALLALSLAPMPTHAIEATQGDVLALPIQQSKQQPDLFCLQRHWPVLPAGKGRWRGWLGIDLRTPPATYTCHWRSDHRQWDTKLTVHAGHFRISRITVRKAMAEFDPATLSRIRREVRALKQCYGMHVPSRPDQIRMQLPVQGIESTPFGARRFVNGVERSPHSGIDIAAPLGTPVHAPLGGKILYVANMYLNGNTVVIGHGLGLVSVLSHMSQVKVRTGDWVRTGDIVGTVGQTGRATGPHLHWSVRFRHARVNPHSLLPERALAGEENLP